jgi:iron complex outermembrane receptor protein
MFFNYLVLSLIFTLSSTTATLAKDLMDPVIVTATKIKTKDTKATYASEVYTQEDIEQSGAKTIYDFLNQNTSVVIQTNSGNKFTQKIDIRGYGITDGYKNVVISVDGRRMNNIDSIPQRLTEIPVSKIDRIEITKGSGSVIYGDGATGGSIQIYTRDSTETSIGFSVGNYGVNTQTLSTGISGKNYILTTTGDRYHHDGFSDSGDDGIKDKGDSNNHSVKLKYFPTESSELFVQKDYTEIRLRYPNALSPETFSQNPGSSYKTTAGVKNYTFETSETHNLTMGGTIDLGNNLEVNLTYTHQEKIMNTVDGEFGATNSNNPYHNNAIDSNLKYQNGPLRIITGVQTWDGAREDKYGTTKKSNIGFFAQSDYDTGKTTYSIGARGEWVNYSHGGEEGANLTKDDSFIAYDIGINRAIDDHLSIFSNLNYSFLAPDIDRFFGYNTNWTDRVFNGFIDPTLVTTLNIGGHHVTPKNKAKLTFYAITLKHEQFYNPKTDTNTNIDSSYKLGLEFQDKFIFNNSLSASINYAYTRPFIDYEETMGDELPGVSDHNVTLGINYKPTSNSRLVLYQNYRSETWALNDIQNNFQQKNSAFTSTDLSYSYFLIAKNKTNPIELTFKVENIFEQSNGSWLNDTAIYPTNFTRNWTIGTKYTF